MAGVNEVTDTNFQAEVIESDQPVLVDFWAPWCGPCRMVAPIVEEIAGERPDLIKLNVVCAGTILIKGVELLHTPLK